MHFAPSGSNCGAATAARFLHLFKFGLVVFRRATFGDGRQSRRLPAAFLYRPGRTQRPEPEDKSCAERSPHPAPSRPRPARPRSCPRSVRSRPAPDVDAQGSPAPHSPVLRHTGANIGTAGASAPPSLPAPEKKRSTPRVLHAICTSSSRLRLKQPQRGFFIY